tara:strand:+ start:735 stop:1076 length:342 start_codon:yes stop_codon:yes gene_type:complete
MQHFISIEDPKRAYIFDEFLAPGDHMLRYDEFRDKGQVVGTIENVDLKKPNLATEGLVDVLEDVNDIEVGAAMESVGSAGALLYIREFLSPSGLKINKDRAHIHTFQYDGENE